MPQGDCKEVFRTTVFGATGASGPAGAGAGDDAGAEEVLTGVPVGGEVPAAAAAVAGPVAAAVAAGSVVAAVAAGSAVAAVTSPAWVVPPPPQALRATRHDASSALRPNLACRM
jgi:hypothetical protein